MIFCVFVFFDSVQAVYAGVISGLGVMEKVKFATVMVYIIVGVPLSLTLMFPGEMEVRGLWYGPTMCCIILIILYAVRINKTDFTE